MAAPPSVQRVMQQTVGTQRTIRRDERTTWRIPASGVFAHPQLSTMTPCVWAGVTQSPTSTDQNANHWGPHGFPKVISRPTPSTWGWTLSGNAPKFRHSSDTVGNREDSLCCGNRNEDAEWPALPPWCSIN